MSQSPDISAELFKAWRLGTAPLRMLPDFILAGAPKCGTSTMYDCIAAHPAVARATRKEPTNFLHYPTSALRSRMYFPFRFEKIWRGEFLTGEASVEYFTHPDAPKNIHGVVPDVKLVFMFREPVARAWSDYQMFVRSGHDKGDFPTVVHQSIRWLNDTNLQPLLSSSLRNSFGPLRYLANSLYWPNVQRWLAQFKRDNCLFLVSEDFFSDPQGETNRVYRHLGLPEVKLPEIPIARMGDYKEQLDGVLKAELNAFFAPHNNKLAEFLGRDLPW